MNLHSLMHGVGFEPTRLSPSDLKSDPLDHSGIRAIIISYFSPQSDSNTRQIGLQPTALPTEL